jgi:hypothetical protein
MNSRVFGIGAFAMLVSVLSARADIIVPTFVSGQNLFTDSAIGASVNNLVNGSGLSSPVPAGVPLASALSVTHAFGPFGEQQSWTTTTTFPTTPDYFSVRPAPVFVWDLAADVSLQDILLWQYGNNGSGANRDGNATLTFSLRFNTAAEGTSFSGPSDFSGTMTRVWATGGINALQLFPIANVTARYVELTLTDNYFGQPGVIAGGDRSGLGELRFNGTPVAVPEPASLLLSGAGVVGAALRRRRK